MRPLKAGAPLPPITKLKGILCDIDDTLTWEGRLVPSAFAALGHLQERGLRVIPITGRPAGWVDQIARLWPVDGVVGENGGLWAWMGPRKLEVRFLQGIGERDTNRARLNALADQILRDIPGCALASDQAYRALDLAIDFCEDVEPLGEADIARIVSMFTAAGARCKVSSIHVNGWFGAFDKLSGVRHLLRDRWNEDLEPEEWIYVGDSPNDEPMFAQFPHSVGVANVSHFLPRMLHWPTWITEANGGHGFAQLAQLILGNTPVGS